MKKQFLLYILFVASLLQACSTDCDEPDSETPGKSEILSLTVTASDIVVSDGLSTRSVEVGKSTIFQEGKDTVGLIVLDKAGNLLVDNVPYRYDDSNWNFVGSVDKQPYYDAAMSTYIVYYPYKKEVDGCKSVDDIKSKKAFVPLEYQTTEEEYRQADILAYTYKGEATRHINADMKHVYDSFTFRICIKWKLEPINEEIAYQPIQETLKNFKLVFISEEKKDTTILFDNDDAAKNRIYRHDDGSYRYLLSAEKEGTISWQYTYRDITFRGERKIPAKTSGTRYVHHEKADMGDLPGPNMEISDFYCSSGNKGYVIPWDAADRINEMSEPKVECLYGRHCIGIVVGVGQHDNDFSDYSDSGIYAEREIKEKSCHGYAMALTDSGAQVEWAKASTPGAKLVGTYNHDFPERAIFDWNGFYNYQKIEEFIINSTTHTSLEDFPAENACRNYGNDCGLSAPGNTTGWFLPSAGMIDFVWKKNDDIKTALTKDNKMSALLAERFATIKNYLEDDWVYKTGQYTYIDNIKGFDTAWSYWTSNEENSHTLGKSAYYVNIESCAYISKSNKTTTSPTKNITVRAFLAF